MKTSPIQSLSPSSRVASHSRDADRELASSFLSSLLEMSAWQQQRLEERRVEATQTPETPSTRRESSFGQVIDRFQWFGAQLNDALLLGRRPPPPAPKTETQLDALEQIQTSMEIGLMRTLMRPPPAPPPVEELPAKYRNRAVRLYQEHALMI